MDKKKAFALLTLISLGVALVSVIAHNLVSLFIGVEEPVFLWLALLSPLGVAVGILGWLGIYLHKLTRKS